MTMIVTNNDDDNNYKNNKLLQSCSPQISPTSPNKHCKDTVTI